MAAFLQRFPFFQLIESEQEAEAAIEALACFATIEEREHLLPLILQMKQHLPYLRGQLSLADAMNNLLAGYLAMYGDFSDRLLIMLSEDLAKVGPTYSQASPEPICA